MTDQTRLLHPPVIWAQRKDVVYLTICLQDTKSPDIRVEEDKMTFRSKGGDDQKEYGFDFKFYKDIVPTNSKQNVTPRQIMFVLKKKEENEPYWPRLLSTTDKVRYIKTDFKKWKDEDDSEDEDDAANHNFEDMMKQMGDIKPGGEVEDGAQDSDDSDDGDMPGLEENASTADGPSV